MRVTETDAFTGYNSWIQQGGHYTSESLVQLAKAMRTDARADKGDGRGRFRPSLIGDECDRKQILSYRHHSGSDGGWYAWSGTFLHLAFQSYLLDIWPQYVRIEYPVKPDRRRKKPGVTGKMDWRWDGPDSHVGMSHILGPHIGDYKTIYSMKMVANGPKPMHLAQVGYEMLTTGIHTAYIVYQDRTHGVMKAFLIEPDDDDLQAMRERLQRLTDMETSGGLFPMLDECRAKKGAFLKCDFSDICLKAFVDDGRDERLSEGQGETSGTIGA